MTLLIIVIAIVGYLCVALPLAVIFGRMIAAPYHAEPNRTEHAAGAVGGSWGEDATIVMTCQVCSTLVRVEHIDGHHLVERTNFLAAHRACLSHIASSSRRHRTA